MLISVVLTTFNGATRGFLGDAIESVLVQTDREFELLLVDDGSTDGTGALCSAYLDDDRVRYLRKENGGVASARNAGIEQARGPLICFLDDDDRWVPEKLGLQRQLFSSHVPTPGLIYTAIQVVDESGRPLYVQSHPARGDLYQQLFYENPVDATSSVMISRDAIRKVGTFREDIFAGALQGCEDRELWSRVAREFPIVSIDKPLTHYRLHSEKLSARQSEMEESELAMLRIALAAAPSPIKDRSSDIYGHTYSRFAMNRFTLGNFAEFRRYCAVARAHGRITLGMQMRYALSFFPFLVKQLRRVVRRPALQTPTLSAAPK